MTRRPRKSQWEEVASVTSRTDPTHVWTVKRNRATNELGCDCPRWIFKPACLVCGTNLVKRPEPHAWFCQSCGGLVQRGCKHIAAYRNGEGRVVIAQRPAAAGSATNPLRELAERQHLGDRLSPKEWGVLAEALGDLGRNLPAPAEGRAGLRHIVLED